MEVSKETVEHLFSLFEECQDLFDRGHEKWNSYFSRWERFAKYEEEVPESELFSESLDNIKSSNKKKVKKLSDKKRSNSLVPASYRKSSKKKKVITRRRLPLNRKHELIQFKEPSDDKNSAEDMGNVELEKMLKTVFEEFFKANQNQIQMFTVLSQTFSDRGEMNTCQIFHKQIQPSYDFRNVLQTTPKSNENCRSIWPKRNCLSEKLNMKQNSFLISPRLRNRDWEGMGILNKKYKNNLYGQELHISSQLLKVNPALNLEIRNCSRALFPSFDHRDTKLKPFEWDMSLQSPGSKINKESFIKRSFLKMNIAVDGKRFRNLCLGKRTNSVTLSMENSNFITPERKPPEWKCFSENVLHGKRRGRPSKLFFDNEEENSESDDQTEKQTPIIHRISKKLKTDVIPDIPDSDSDDYESIFDRTKKT